MNVDLYRDDLERLSAEEFYSAVREFTGIDGPLEDRIAEGYLLDFKSEWNEGALKTVAAFANTFGGLLIVGVQEATGRAGELAGVPVKAGQELKTTVANSIASNITPWPSCQVFDRALPADRGRQLCLVRVRRSDSLHLLTRGDKPVYVREGDRSVPADAARLQALLARLHRPAAPRDISSKRLEDVRPWLYVTHARAPASLGGSPEDREGSASFLHVALLPDEPLAIELDLGVERAVRSLIENSYPELLERVQYTSAQWREQRSRHDYRVTYLEHVRDHEMVWGVNSSGELHFVTEVSSSVAPSGCFWSLADVMTNLESAIETAHRFWDFLGYIGEGRLAARLEVSSLPLFRSEAGYEALFYSSGKILASDNLQAAVKEGIVKPTRTDAEARVNFATRTGSRAEVLASLTNQLLRDLGHAVDIADLRALHQPTAQP
jgi:hypothetical protein